MSAARLEHTPLLDVVLVHLDASSDARGSTCTLLDPTLFGEAAAGSPLTYLAHSRSLWGVVRGLFVLGHETRVAVRAARGAAFLVVVDLRRGSPTHAKAWWRIVRATEPLWVHVPPGCAWGMQALDDGTEVEELRSSPCDDSTPRLRWNDPALGIPWPLPPRWLTERELQAPTLAAWQARP